MGEGDAVRVGDPHWLERLAEAWATKWDGRYQFVVRDSSLTRRDGQDTSSCTPSRPRGSSRSHEAPMAVMPVMSSDVCNRAVLQCVPSLWTMPRSSRRSGGESDGEVTVEPSCSLRST